MFTNKNLMWRGHVEGISHKCQKETGLINPYTMKAVHNQDPKYLHTNIFPNSNLCYAATRDQTKLHLLRSNMNFYRNSFEFQGIMTS